MSTDNKQNDPLDQPEVEILPGIYVTDFRKQDQSNQQHVNTINNIEDLDIDINTIPPELLEEHIANLEKQVETFQKLVERRAGDMLNGIQDLPPEEFLIALQERIMRLDNMTRHLASSQDQLREMNENMDPPDQDLIDAYNENVPLLKIQRAQLEYMQRVQSEFVRVHFAPKSDDLSSNTSYNTVDIAIKAAGEPNIHIPSCLHNSGVATTTTPTNTNNVDINHNDNDTEATTNTNIEQDGIWL